jgi:hypothetical protein
MSVDHAGFQIYLGDKREPGESGTVMEERGDNTKGHMVNFLEAVQSRRREDLHGEIAEGVASAELVHLANTSYRLGRKLSFDPAADKYINDAQANAMLTRPVYREPYNPARV